MQNAIKLLRTITIVVFLGVLLFVYAYLPNEVGIVVDQSGTTSAYIDKEVFFYMGIGVFILINLIFMVFSNMFKFMNVSPDGFFRTLDFKDDIQNWFISLGLVINLFLISVVAFIGFFNNADYYNISSFSLLAYMGQALIFIWIILFFYLVFGKR